MSENLDLSGALAQPYEIRINPNLTIRLEYLTLGNVVEYKNWLQVQAFKEMESAPESIKAKLDARIMGDIAAGQYNPGGNVWNGALQTVNGTFKMVEVLCRAISGESVRKLTPDEQVEVLGNETFLKCYALIIEESIPPKARWRAM